MVIAIVLIGVAVLLSIWGALVISGRADEREEEYQPFSRDDDDDE